MDMDDDFDSFVSRVLTSISEQISSIRAAIRDGDAERLQQIAHPVKSTSGYLGAMSMSVLAQQLETLGKSGTTEGALPSFEKLKGEWDVVKPFLEKSLEASAEKPEE